MYFNVVALSSLLCFFFFFFYFSSLSYSLQRIASHSVEQLMMKSKLSSLRSCLERRASNN